jgi:hypothetical protein
VNADVTIRTANFDKGRTEPISLIVVHSAETPCQSGVARAVATMFATEPISTGASSHYVCDPELVVGCVDEDDTAWHAAPVNPRSIGIEHSGYARYTAADWQGDAEQKMLARSAGLVADICARRGIPVAFVDAAGLLRGDGGITTHAAVSEACRLALAQKLDSLFAENPKHPGQPRSDHTDPGPNWPMDAYLEMVRAALPAPAPAVDAPADPVDAECDDPAPP